jgi:hypothetical protein
VNEIAEISSFSKPRGDRRWGAESTLLVGAELLFDHSPEVAEVANVAKKTDGANLWARLGASAH